MRQLVRYCKLHLWCFADETLKVSGKPTVNDASASVCHYPASQLLDKADDYVNSLDYDLARRFCQRALEVECENTRALETLAFVELQCGDYEQARHVFFLFVHGYMLVSFSVIFTALYPIEVQHVLSKFHLSVRLLDCLSDSLIDNPIISFYLTKS